MDNVVIKQNSVETLIQETYNLVFRPFEDFIKNGCKPVASIAKWNTKAGLSLNNLDQENIKNQGQVIRGNQERSKLYMEAVKEGKTDDNRLKLLKEECEAGYKRDMEAARLGREAAINARADHNRAWWIIAIIAGVPTIIGALGGIGAAISSGKDKTYI